MVQREDFFERVWELVAEIPYGRVATYGQLADMLGYPRHARLAGAAMHHAPQGLPCPPGRRLKRALRAPLARAANIAFAGRRFHFARRQGRSCPLSLGRIIKTGKKTMEWQILCIASSGFFMIGFVRTER